MQEKNRKLQKIVSYGMMLFLMIFLWSGKKIQAAEYSITPASMVLYSNEGTVVYAQADFASQIITVMNAELPVTVMGITSNGWYQVTTGSAIYFIPQTGLHSKDQESVNLNTPAKIAANESLDTRIKKATKGTFSFYSKIQLDSMKLEDLKELSVNDYIKYLDSYLVGKSDPGKAIRLDSGLTIQKEYATKKILHAKMTAKSVREYLYEYRNHYLMESFWGPVKSIDDVKVCVNRAIRYDIDSFTVVCHEYEIGDNEIKMQSKINKMLQQVIDEQGIEYVSKMSYGTYIDENGNSAAGFIIELSKKLYYVQ